MVSLKLFSLSHVEMEIINLQNNVHLKCQHTHHSWDPVDPENYQNLYKAAMNVSVINLYINVIESLNSEQEGLLTF